MGAGENQNPGSPLKGKEPGAFSSGSVAPGEGVRGAAGRGGLVECQFSGGKARTTQRVQAGPLVSQRALVQTPPPVRLREDQKVTPF